MKYLNIGLAQINPLVGDLDGNLGKILEVLEEVHDKVHVVIFPELALTGYPPEDLLVRRDFLRDTMASLEKLLRATHRFETAILVGQPYYDGKSLFNSALLLHKGALLGMYHKRYLPQYGVFEEKRYFMAGQSLLLFEVAGITCGVSLCEDIWYPSGIERVYALSGAEVLICLNASPYVREKYLFKENFLRAMAEDNQAYVVYVNMVGGQDDLVFDGRSLVISPQGKILARAKAFEEDLLLVSLPMEPLENLRLLEPRLREELKREELKAIQVSVNKRWNLPYYEGRLEEALVGEAELYEALKLSLADYVRKNGFRGVILGLSGGIDSALVATLAVDALGREHVKALFMPSEFTSQESYEDARSLAENLGISLLEVPITSIFNTFRKEIGENLGYRDFTVAEENLQARIRANILFYCSNREGYLVLSTSNKSESATGYGTIYGDIAGGFAPLRDVYKTWVYQLARYRNSISPVIPERIFTKPPSAELRPGQIDQETLPPYEVLDEILSLHLEEGFTPEELIEKGFEERTVRKVMKMLKIAEYKRRQAPPGPKVTRRAFGKDYRMPITSGYL